MKLHLKFCTFALAIAAASSSLAVGPTSTLYASRSQEFGVQSGLDRIQGASFNTGSTGSFDDDAIAVYGDVRLAGYNLGALGYRFDLNGNSLPGGPYSDTYAADPIFDGTSDGTYNYGLGFFGGQIIRYDRNWNNATPLFVAGTPGATNSGITMNVADGSFWVSDFSSAAMVRHYSSGGTLLFSFFSGIAGAYGLAFDSADGTLWMNDVNNPFTLTQFDQSGNLLQSVNYGVGGRNWYGMEFNTAVPEPASMAALGLGIAALIRRRKKS